MNVFSQEKNIQHTIEKGETISGIAKYYNIKPSEIYDLNPEARNGIKYKGVLVIPAKARKNDTVLINDTKTTTYEVQPKETLYGIAKQHNVKVEDLYKINPDLEKEGLKIGQVINVPQTGSLSAKPEKPIEVKKPNVSKNTPKEEVVVTPKKEKKSAIPTEGITYEILPKESLYSIAKKYGITLADLQKANPELENKTLKVGQKIIVPVKADINSNSPKVIVEQKNPETEISHEVLPKETKYGIAKQYALTIAELEKQNPNIVNNLLVGSVLKIRSSKVIEIKPPVEIIVIKEESEKKESTENVPMTHDAAFVDQLISTASENIGTRYRSGGTTKEGFDCSGLMYYTFSNSDIKLPRSSYEMATYGSKIDTENAQKGDLIFFKTNGRGRINHVGMVVEVLEGEIKFIHSSTSSGVIISSTKESYYEKSFVQVNRVL
ncbi:MAG: LysM peptidoglycan-binding domain-containing protein [Bacteroidota bacterium]